jgi:hypothetical protein
MRITRTNLTYFGRKNQGYLGCKTAVVESGNLLSKTNLVCPDSMAGAYERAEILATAFNG